MGNQDFHDLRAANTMNYLARHLEGKAMSGTYRALFLVARGAYFSAASDGDMTQSASVLYKCTARTDMLNAGSIIAVFRV